MPPRLRLALLLAAALSQSGCAVGYMVVRPGEEPARAPRADWSAHRFTLEGSPRDRCAVERVLLERYGALDVRSGPREDGAFHLAVSRERASPDGVVLALGLVSVLTFSVVPGYLPDDADVRFTVDRPDGARFSGAGRQQEGTISWLPLFLLAPTAMASVNGGGDEADLARLDAAETLAAGFLRSAEPFVAGAPGVAP